MKKLLFILTLTLIIIGCSIKYEDSKIEVIKYDKELVRKIQSDYDSTYTEKPKREDFWEIDFYISDSIESRIMKDSIGNIVAVAQFKNGMRIFVEEYFPNGQLRVKHNFPPDKIDGPITSYYPNGQIKSKGQWKDYKRVGEWRNYKPSGKLESIELYDNNGELEKEELLH